MRGPVFPIPVCHSLEAVSGAADLRQVYPDDLFPNGDYVQLPYGRVRYWLLGPENGQRIVLIHGISTPSITWKDIAPYLAAHGLRVLVYDLYGKGYSEAPKINYDATLFITQLALLLQYVRWDSAHIVGFSMGGGIAAAFAAMFPHLVAGKVVLMASSGLVERFTPKSAPEGVISQYQQFRELQERFLPGYRASVKSCFTHGPVRKMSWAFGKLADLHVGPERTRLQVLLIHGTADGVVPYGESLKIADKVPGARLIGIAEGGHDIHTKEGHRQQVAENIANFTG